MKPSRIALALVAALALAAPLGAASAASAGPLKVKLRAAGQKRILKDRGLKVRVRARQPMRVKLRARSRTFDDRKLRRLARSRVVRFGRPGKRSVRLKLTRRGRKRVRSCEGRKLKVTARGGGRRARSGERLKRQRGRCRLPKIDLSAADRCDFIASPGNPLCLLPFPNDYYTVEDAGGAAAGSGGAASATGRRVNLRTQAMPANKDGKHIDARPYNAADGFSPGQPIVLRVPGIDTPKALQQSAAVPINHIGRFADPDQSILLIDAETGERQPIWAEIDSNAGKPEDVSLIIHPAQNLAYGHRYIVALRKLRTAAGERIEAPAAFRYYRDDIGSRQKPINRRREHFEQIFKALRRVDVRRKSLYLAWDFTVASAEGVAGRLLHIRDKAFAQLGDTDLDDLAVQGASPGFGVDTVTDLTSAEDSEVAREIRGTVTVPCYLAPDCAPGGSYRLGADGLPTRNGTWEANFRCIVPRSAVDGMPSPARVSLFGHGLFGNVGELGSGLLREFANQHNFVLCATDEIGMSSNDLPNTAGILNDLSEFPELADRVQQGLLNELYLGRTMIHADGFAGHPAFHIDGTLGTESVLDRSNLYYEGNSQGGILGGALTAVAPDFTRAVLGVPGMRYSLLLTRATPFDQFAAVLYPSYPDELGRPLMLSLIQMLWDRADPNGYARRMTSNPFPNTPAHKVLMSVALGDHQVTNFAADVEARTIGARAHVPILDPGRWPGVDVLWGVPPIPSYPYSGSAIIYSDIGPIRPDPSNPSETIGTTPPPLENVPNRAGEDPHGAPRGTPDILEMVGQFLSPGGAIGNECGNSPCYAGGYTGP